MNPATSFSSDFMRILCLDVGSKTIGLALSDPMGWTAQGLETVQRKDWDADARALEKVLEEYEVKKILVGLPLRMDGVEGDQSRLTRVFVTEMQKRIRELPVIFWDERLSTVGASRSLLEADMSREKRRKVIDKMAAVFILQGYLDSQRPSEVS